MTASVQEWLFYLGVPLQIAISGVVFIGLLTIRYYSAHPLQLMDAAAIAWSIGVVVWFATFLYLSHVKLKIEVQPMLVGLLLLYPTQLLVAIAMTGYWIMHLRLGAPPGVAALIFFLFSLLDIATRSMGVEYLGIDKP